LPTVEISFIIPVFNAGEMLARCVSSIQKQDIAEKFEIIVVDNGSTDGAVEQIEAGGVRVVRESVKGAASARNLGIKESCGRFLAFLDADIELDPNWARECAAMLRSPWIDCVQSPIVPDCLRGTRMRSLREAFISFKTKGTFNYLNRSIDGLPVVNSAAFMMRKALIESRSLQFDPQLLRCEDLDFSYQLFFRGCSFATVSTTQARVFDTRGIFAYLRRSFWTGYYTAGVRALWRVSGVVRFRDRVRGLSSLVWQPSGFAFIYFNFLATYLGELVGTRAFTSATSAVIRRAEPDHKNSLLLRLYLKGQNTEFALSPLVRWVRLDESWMMIDVASGKRIRFEGKNAERIERILTEGAGSSKAIEISGLHEMDLVRDMCTKNFLISAHGQATA